jgi:hypothetical protein
LVVRSFFERMQARDWDGAEELLFSAAVIEFSATGERFRGEDFVAMNAAYPEGWSIEVVDTLTDGDRVAAQVRVTQGDDVFWCAGFYRVGDGQIDAGVEHWVSEGSESPPEWRRRFTIPADVP